MIVVGGCLAVSVSAVCTVYRDSHSLTVLSHMYTQSDLTWGGHASSGLDFLTKPLEGKLFFE